MATIRRFRSISLMGLFALCMLLLPKAYAQTSVEATITSTNFDVKTKTIYAEMNYTPRTCGNYQIRFYLKTVRTGEQEPNQKTMTAISLDTAYSNVHGSQKISTHTGGTLGSPYTYNVLNLDRTSVGGYFLRFSLDSDHEELSSADTAEVCLQVFRTAYDCSTCRADYTSRAFTDKNIELGCPYRDDNPNSSDDLVACEQSTAGAKNWWAWVQDPRDCNVYKVVKMSDGRWWFARNLNYQAYIDYNPGSRTDPSLVKNKPVFFCPGPQGLSSNTSPYYETGDNDRVKWGCQIYGALYPWKTIMALDGDGPDSTATPPTNMATSKVRGICPPGWYVPNDYDWGVMLNYAEGTPCAGKETVPSDNRTPPNTNCNHLTRVVGKATPYTSAITGTSDNSSGRDASPSALNGMGTAGTTDTVFYNRLGSRASRVLKLNSSCGGPVSCDNDNQNNFSNKFGLYTDGAGSTSSATPRFAYTRWVYSTNQGLDEYGLSVQAAGFRHSNGSSGNGTFLGRGSYAIFASSTYADKSTVPVLRMFTYNEATVTRFFGTEANSLYSAFSVRCIK